MPWMLWLAISSLYFVSLVSGDDKDDPCFLESAARIQIAWVLDRTSEYVHKGSVEMDITAKIAVDLGSSLEKDYPGTQYSVSIYSDWPNAAGPPRGPRNPKKFGIGVPDEEFCCLPHLNFTSDKDELDERIRSVKHGQSGRDESVLTCILFTAASTTLGWDAEYDESGRRVVKFLIFVANEENTETLTNPGPRTQPVGDGSDTCSLRTPPTKPYMVVENALKKAGITVIGLLDHNPKLEKDPMQIWKEIMAEMDEVPYYSFWRKNASTPDELRKVIKENAHKYRGKVPCVWEDPPAYSTLGY